MRSVGAGFAFSSKTVTWHCGLEVYSRYTRVCQLLIWIIMYFKRLISRLYSILNVCSIAFFKSAHDDLCRVRLVRGEPELYSFLHEQVAWSASSLRKCSIPTPGCAPVKRMNRPPAPPAPKTFYPYPGMCSCRPQLPLTLRNSTIPAPPLPATPWSLFWKISRSSIDIFFSKLYIYPAA